MSDNRNLRRPQTSRWLKTIGLALAFAGALSLTTSISARDKEKEPPHPSLKPAAILDNDADQQPQQRTEEHAARRAIERESFYDSANPDLGTLQKMPEFTRSINMPFDPNGFPDWMRALREGSINPRASLNGKASMEVLDKDIIMRNTKEMPNVRFPHNSHTMWLACSNCHPKPFNPVAGTNAIRMADIFRGEFCGMCHDRVAFITFFSCSRCHSVPQNTANVAGKP